MPSPKHRVEELRRLLNHHNYLYYVEAAPEISDREFDQLLKELQTLSTLPADYKGGNGCAEVQVHPSGKFLYGSNRGHNSITVFKIDAATGKLTAAGHQADGIKTPRNFGIDPTGAFVIVANQDGGNLILFRVDPNTGALTATGSTVEVSKPVCVKFLRPSA